MVILADSFAANDAKTATGPLGQIGHEDLIEHTDCFSRQLHTVRPGVWCMVGNGLSNQTFVSAPDGLIVIDTGESVQEMRAALEEVRQHTQDPVAAVIYTHFHYVAGTQAVLDEKGEAVPIWGHAGIVGNRQRVGSEVGAAAGRGLIHQFGIRLPPDGPDAIINVGLGLEFRSADHSPFTPGFVPPSDTIDRPMSATIAGLDVEFTPAPSDADDSITIWFPGLSVCVHNIVWPTLFNVFAIRGEEYRDPRLLLEGLDHVASLNADHLVGAHGPPLSGRDQIAAEVETYRDSIQFLWDQTVRGINRGLTMDELTQFVQLPDDFGQSYLTRQFYGIVEHHVRQIHAGLRGWFDGDESKLLPVPPVERAQRLIEGFGGIAAVRSQAIEALEADDVRWALELASWLVHRDVDEHGRADAGEDVDRQLLARALRTVAQRTTAANLRNWCLTRALELDGSLDLNRFRIHRFSRGEVASNSPEVYVKALRVLLVPDRAAGLDEHLRFDFDDGTSIGLHVRHCVAVPTSGDAADLAIELDLDTWASILAKKLTLNDAIADGSVRVSGDIGRVRGILGCFDIESLTQ
jgi:alkyl sulfatase BDS1-like metallo-beta-lactamase superfamily hydrolase